MAFLYFFIFLFGFVTFLYGFPVFSKGNILGKCHTGAYHDVIRSGATRDDEDDESNGLLDEYKNSRDNLLNQLVDGGVLFLLRVNLDDQTESVINASLSALANLIQPGSQETALDLQYDLNSRVDMPSLHPFSSIFDTDGSRLSVDKNVNVSERKELSELKDDEYVRHDLIGGLLRMSLMERVHYLLDKYRPSLSLGQVLANVFAILHRCMRHSADFCLNFCESYAKLFNLIMSNFLPLSLLSSGVGDDASAAEIELNTVADTLKLVRLVSCSGPALAYRVFQKFDLKSKLLAYLASELSIATNPGLRSHVLRMKTGKL
jgi:hypothetical protein